MSAQPNGPGARVEVVQGPAVTTLRLAGEVDASIVDEAGLAVDAVVEADLPVVVDVGDVAFMDCSGLRIVATLLDRVPHEVRVAGASPTVAFLLETAGLAELVTHAGLPRVDSHTGLSVDPRTALLEHTVEPADVPADIRATDVPHHGAAAGHRELTDHDLR